MTTTARARVLCVDDEASILAALHRQLRHRYDVVLAQGAAAGMAQLREAGPFAVILSDLHMPGCDGRTFLTAARTVAPHTLALLMTGSTDDAMAAAGLDELVFGRIEKPCMPDVLWSAIDAALAAHALQMARR